MESNEVEARTVNAASIKRSKNIEAVNNAYKGLLNNKEGADKSLLEAVTKYAKVKMNKALYGTFKEYEEEDHAQDIALYVWQNLDSFRGNPDYFHSWLSKICYTYGAQAQNEAVEERKLRVPLYVESEDGDEEDNPLIYLRAGIHEHAREIPDFIRGTDLMICKLIRKGLDYEEIGQKLGLTEKAVERRVDKIREKVEALDLPKQRAENLAEYDKSWADAKGPIVRNEDPMVRSGEPYSDWITWYIGEVDRARAKYGV